MDKVLCLLKMNTSITKATKREIRELALRKGGFDPQHRKFIWMKLLDVKYTSSSKKNFILSQDDANTRVSNLREYNLKDKSAVDPTLFLDLPRTHHDASTNEYFPKHLFHQKSPDLFRLKSLQYSYYQGFLDIEYFLFNVLHDDNDSQCSDYFIGLQHFSEKYVKDYLTVKDMVSTVKLLLQRFIEVLEPDVMRFILLSDFYLETCIGWPLTLFTHYISDTRTINRLFDYFLSSPPIAVYLVSMVLLKKLITQSLEKKEELIHISQLNYSTLDFDQLLIETEQYMTNPSSMRKINVVLNEFCDRFPCICASRQPINSRNIQLPLSIISYVFLMFILFYCKWLIIK